MAKSRFFLALSVALLAGCVSFDYRYSPAQEQQLISRVLAIAPEAPLISPLYLSESAKAVLDKRIKRGWGDEEKLNQLRDFLFDKKEMHLSYSADKTKTAMEVWQTHTGNCLSMTSLFIAAARYVGLDAGYETVDVRPTWDQQGDTMIRYEHIIAVGHLIGGREYVVDFLPDFVIGDRKSMRITDRQAVALYYNNLGAESLIDGRTKQAASYLAQAVQINGSLSDAWNNLGAALRRSGDDELAEFAFQRAVHLDMDNYSALTNLAQFYQSRGMEAEAKYFVARINAYRRRNPYYHYYIAHYLYEQGEYKKAIYLLEAAVSLKRDEPEFYLALARSYAKLGNNVESRHYKVLAAEYAKGQRMPAPRARDHRFWIQNYSVN